MSFGLGSNNFCGITTGEFLNKTCDMTENIFGSTNKAIEPSFGSDCRLELSKCAKGFWLLYQTYFNCLSIVDDNDWEKEGS